MLKIELYLKITITVYLVYFLMMLPSRVKNLYKWKKYHYDNENKNDCKDDESYKCLGYGNLIEKYMIGNIDYIALRALCLYYKDFFPLVLLNDISNVTNHMLRWKKWGIHYFGFYHLICLLFDIYFITKTNYNN